MVEMRHADTTERIIRCAIDVHKALGPGLPLEIYGKALAIELERSGLGVLAEVTCKVVYREIHLGERRVPFVVNDVVVVVPSTTEIDETAIAAGVAMLRASGKSVGLLLNFARARLDIRRIAN